MVGLEGIENSGALISVAKSTNIPRCKTDVAVASNQIDSDSTE